MCGRGVVRVCVGGRGGECVLEGQRVWGSGEGQRVCGSGEGWTVCVGGAKSVWESEVLSLSVRATKKRTFFAASLIGQPFISPPLLVDCPSKKGFFKDGRRVFVCGRGGVCVCGRGGVCVRGRGGGCGAGAECLCAVGKECLCAGGAESVCAGGAESVCGRGGVCVCGGGVESVCGRGEECVGE